MSSESEGTKKLERAGLSWKVLRAALLGKQMGGGLVLGCSRR